MPATVTPIDRALRIKKMRDYEVDRTGIVERAIIKAVESGYEFDASSPLKRRDMQRQSRLRYDGERPLAQYAALIDPDMTERLLKRLGR